MKLPPLPKNPRHQRFADLILREVPRADAYVQAGFKVTNRVAAQAAATRLLGKPYVASYIAAMRLVIQEDSATAAVLSVIEKRQFLARIVRTPLLSIDPHTPDKDGDLIKTYQKTDTETSSSERIEKLDPLKAIEIDNKLSCDDGERDGIAALTAALASLAVRSPLPDETMPIG